jgi:uncharacterized SAM-binding protein YcdF (DUF218 family)
MILMLASMLRLPGTAVPFSSTLYHSPQELPTALQLDVVVVLGGGVPFSLEIPLPDVQRRCDDAAAVVQSRSIPILCLSAGTKHRPQLLSEEGLPIWESTSCAAYLEVTHGIRNVFVETTSYDTIGNAFFARTSHTDIVGWRKLLIVTNEVRN